MGERPRTEYPVRATSGWASTFPAFREAPAPYVRGRLSAFLPDASPEQVAAWDESIPPLQREVGEVLVRDDRAADYGAILEYQLPLNHRRPDALFLLGGSVLVVEVKGKDRPSRADIDQVSAYARDLRAYHESCQGRPVHPILMLTRAQGRLGLDGGVHVVGPDVLDELVEELDGPPVTPLVEPDEFLSAERYRPMPSLVKAARELFETGDLRRIRRAAAATGPAIATLTAVAHEAAASKTRHLVLVTGSPGTGKTLVGLAFVHASFLDDLAVARPNGAKPLAAVFLSGNGPLVEVLQYELRSAGGGGRTFVRDVRSYVERYLGDPRLVPGEHVVVFDEAQRAWDAAKVAREHKSVRVAGSEPDHLIEFASRIPEWAVVVALVGSGQEIHDGEETGLEQWRWALEQARDGAEWTVTVPPSAAGAFADRPGLRVDRSLELVSELRYHSSTVVHEFVDGLLSIRAASELATLAQQLDMESYHLRLTRDIAVAKQYLIDRYANNPDARFGVIASSRDKDLPRFGVSNDWNATKNVRKGPWFCDGDDEPFGRSCRSLRECVTEFGCQGLELDASLVAWGTDFILEGGRWTNQHARRYQTPHLIRDAFQLRRNAYRVLLTRGRDATVVFVPPIPALDETHRWLLDAGFTELGDASASPLGADAAAPQLASSDSLAALIEAARRASLLDRILLRDPIADHGPSALGSLVGLANEGLGAFAVKTIVRIAEAGAREDAVKALREIDRSVAGGAVVSDIEAALAKFAPPRARSSPGQKAAHAEPAHDRLVAGRRYRRTDLHAARLGGNRQKGISYPATGTHVLLFSGGTGRSDYGYDDQWLDEDLYRYFGEWSGPGDMTMTGGNARIIERSPRLFLFIQRSDRLQEFVGQFEYVRDERILAVRDGREARAIAFVLRLIATEATV